MNDGPIGYWSEDMSASLSQAMVRFDGPLMSFHEKVTLWKELMTASKEEVAEELGTTPEAMDKMITTDMLVEFGESLTKQEDWEFMEAPDEGTALLLEFLVFAKWITNHMMEFLGNKTVMDIDKFLEKGDG